MPIVNGAYDAPTWNNNAPPAIDASELQDMCDTIETYNTQKADVDYVNTFVRPNLLDNWYFVGGGSQQGGGKFPINQRGETSYSGSVYMNDRWTGLGAQSRLELTSGGVKFYRASTSDSGRLTQRLDPGILSSLEGQKVTLSILFDSLPTTTTNALLMLWNNTTIGQVNIEPSSPKLMSVTITVPTSGYSTADASYQRVQFTTNALSANAGVIKAMKLEIGSTQTLAHQENGTWVLNEVPNYEEQLARCQRHQVRIGYHSGSTYANPIGFGYAVSATAGRLFVPTPVTLRTSPSIEYFNSETAAKFVIFGSGSTFAVSAASCITYDSGVMLSLTSSGLTTNEDYTLQWNSTNGFLFTANL